MDDVTCCCDCGTPTTDDTYQRFEGTDSEGYPIFELLCEGCYYLDDNEESRGE